MANFIHLFLDLLFAPEAKESTPVKPDERYVAAGDPALQLSSFEEDLFLLPEERKQVNGLRQFKVCGSSMSPCGISNGDLIYAEKVTGELKRNDFIVVSVDQRVYDTPIRFAYKMRRYLLDVSCDEDLNNVILQLGSFHKEILEPEYRERLEKKFRKTKGFYPTDDLCLSMTFRNGDLRYSFHPKRLVEYKVQYIAQIQSQKLVHVSTIAAY